MDLQSFVAVEGAAVGGLLSDADARGDVQVDVGQQQEDAGGAEERQGQPVELVPGEEGVDLGNWSCVP